MTDAAPNTTRRKRSPRRVVAIVLIVVPLVVLSIDLTWRLLERTNANASCASCHEMDRAVESWIGSSHYVNRSGMHVDCIDCHLPPKDNIIRFAAVKGVKGLRDLTGHLLQEPYDARAATERLLRTIPDTTCTECHAELFSPRMTDEGRVAHRAYLYPKTGERRNCLSCHPQVGHRRPVVIEPPETDQHEDSETPHQPPAQ